MDWSCIQLFKCLTLALNLACPALTLTTQHAFTWAAQDRRSIETVHAQIPSNPTQSVHSTSFTSLTHSHIHAGSHKTCVYFAYIFLWPLHPRIFHSGHFHVRQHRTTSTQEKLRLTRKSNSRVFTPYMAIWIIILKLIICLHKLFVGFLALLPIRAGHTDGFGI